MRQIVLAVSWLLAQPAAYAASFDCRKAATDIETIICTDAELARLDEALSTAYERAKKEATDKAAIKKQQREWVADIRNRCGDAACLKPVYTSRIAH